MLLFSICRSDPSHSFPLLSEPTKSPALSLAPTLTPGAIPALLVLTLSTAAHPELSLPPPLQEFSTQIGPPRLRPHACIPRPHSSLTTPNISSGPYSHSQTRPLVGVVATLHQFLSTVPAPTLSSSDLLSLSSHHLSAPTISDPRKGRGSHPHPTIGPRGAPAPPTPNPTPSFNFFPPLMVFGLKLDKFFNYST